MRIELDGKQLIRIDKLFRGEPLVGKAWKGAMKEATDVLGDVAEGRAPRATDKLAGSITTKIQAKPIPLWGKVSFSAKSDKGIRYGGILQGSRKRDYYYQSGPNQGQLTRGWLSGSMRLIKGRVDGILQKAARVIEQTWGRG